MKDTVMVLPNKVNQKSRIDVCRICNKAIEKRSGFDVAPRYYCDECKKRYPNEYQRLSASRDGFYHYTHCCDILEVHHDLLKDDPERLSTDFIKKLSQCTCDDPVP